LTTGVADRIGAKGEPIAHHFSRVVVTGGAGFLGSHLCEALLAAGSEVVCMDNLVTGATANVAHLLRHERFRLVRCDITNFIDVAGPVDLVLHFASPASPVDYLRLPIETMKVGSIGTLHALGLAKTKGARFVLASTSETYGDPLVHPQPETYWGNVNPVGPRAVYDEAKRFGEALTMAYRSRHAVNTAIVRIFNTYGPRMRPNDGRAVPTFITQALAGAPLTVAGDGSQTRSLCYVSDLVRGILMVAESNLEGPVNLGNPTELSVLDIAENVLHATGSPSRIVFVTRPIDDPQMRRPDTSLISTELGWTPQVTWRNGIEHTVNWFQREIPAGHPTKLARESARATADLGDIRTQRACARVRRTT
jgi:dTDP-glucose 4,6-dehydratase